MTPAAAITPIVFSLARVRDYQALGTAWRALEERANGSFFQGWTWTGCLAEERFSDPLLLEARAAGQVVALALFNRRLDRLGREWLYLGESGDPALDCPYIEHNGVLVARGQPADLGARCIAAARRLPLDNRRPWLPRRVVASGVPESLARACGGRILRSQMGWEVDLDAIRRAGGCFLSTRSANTRQQLRRSARALATLGPLSLVRARDTAEAVRFLDELAALHQARWRSRGRPGAFAAPFFSRFHRALIARGLERGEIGLWQMSYGERKVGYLYNFHYHDTVLTYQSGFAALDGGSAFKPGYTAHALVIRHCIEDGLARYDFLAGDARYKRSLGDTSYLMHWVGPSMSLPGRDRLGRLGRWAGWRAPGEIGTGSNRSVSKK